MGYILSSKDPSLFVGLRRIKPLVPLGFQEWVLVYDGPCALCQRSVRWIMERDKHALFRYTPLQSTWTQTFCEQQGIPLPQSVMLVAGSHYWEGAEAVVMACKQLGGRYRIGAFCLAYTPGLKKMYRWLAQHRYSIFGKKEEALTTCPGPRSWREPHPHSY